MRHKRFGLLGLFLNSRSRSLAIPLVVATLFCFGYMFVQTPSAPTSSTSNTKSAEDDSQVSLPEIPLSEQAHLPVIESGDSASSGQAPSAASPQTGAVPNNASANANGNANSSSNNQSPGNGAQKKSTVSEIKGLVPLLP